MDVAYEWAAAGAWMDRFGRSGPSKIICVGLNYWDHASESSVDAPAVPLLFAKAPSSLIGPDEPIVLPFVSDHVDAEAELAVIIGARCRNVVADDALDCVAGYTVANDVSARDIQFADGQWYRGKSFDTFCPVLGDIRPTTELGEASGLRVFQRLNGEVIQAGNTADLIFGVRDLVAHASVACTLLPGDLLLTGTPSGVGYFSEPRIALADGDLCEIEIEGLAVLRNTVRAAA